MQGKKNSPKKQLQYYVLPAWTIQQIDGTLRISGGADARYEIELESAEQSYFHKLKSDDRFSRSTLNALDQRVLEQLITAGIVVPVLQKRQKLIVALLGDTDTLDLVNSTHVSIVSLDQSYDLGIVVRSNSTYAQLLSDISYQELAQPHIFVDVAFHHTVSIGPLVFPGETACIACLEGRISKRWGDDLPPKAPKVSTNNSKLITEIVMMELERIAEGDTSLTNKTCAWNVQDRSIRKDQLLKVPVCPVCTQNTVANTGVLGLPWNKA